MLFANILGTIYIRSNTNLFWHVLYIGTKDGQLKYSYYTNPQPGGQVIINSQLIRKYQFLCTYISTKPTAALICNELCNDVNLPIKSISEVACKNELNYLLTTKRLMKSYLIRNKEDKDYDHNSFKSRFYEFYSAKFINYTLVLHPTGRHHDVFADNIASLENRVCFQIDKIRTNLSVTSYGRGGCGKHTFCFALLDWGTSHLHQREMWTREENQILPYSAQWYVNQGMHDQRFTRNVRVNSFQSNPQLGVDLSQV